MKSQLLTEASSTASEEESVHATHEPINGILLTRRLRRMKRKLFLEAVGEDYIASLSSQGSFSSSSSIDDVSS